MTQEDWKLLLPFVQAGADGKRIEVRLRGTGLWIPVDRPDQIKYFRKWLEDEELRIAPEPTFVPWTDDEVPLDAWYRKSNSKARWCKINSRFVERDSYGVLKKLYLIEGSWYNQDALFDKFEHSTDGGKTWERCGKEVAQ